VQTKNLSLHDLIGNMPITGISMDSRTVKPGDLFFALNPLYIDEAVQKGAKIIICEKAPIKKYNIPIIPTDDLRNKIGIFASEFYHQPSKNLHIIGVTGTNGKTSCTHFIAQAFKMAGFKSAVMGTLGNGFIEHINPGTHTTPDPILLQQLLADFAQQKTDFIAMEASSHGLEQGRLNGVNIETGVFTNLTRDHLDYHQNMENYAQAKFRLFEHQGLKHAVLNLDDAYGLEWAKKLKSTYPKLDIYGITTSSTLPIIDIPIISAGKIQTSITGLTAEIKSPWGENTLNTNLLGKFNLSNLLCVLTVLGIYKLSLENIVNYLGQLKTAPGRMEMLGGTSGKPLIIIDYAHTPDALLKTLQALREHCEGELWCIFGCGGDRDQGKRPEMGAIAEQYADQMIITDDNPRSENPANIIADIRKGLVSSKNIIIEHDRRRAIEHALSSTKEGDIILIAGKGHETYQEIGNQKIPYNDSLAVKILLLD